MTSHWIAIRPLIVALLSLPAPDLVKAQSRADSIDVRLATAAYMKMQYGSRPIVLQYLGDSDVAVTRLVGDSLRMPVRRVGVGANATTVDDTVTMVIRIDSLTPSRAVVWIQTRESFSDRPRDSRRGFMQGKRAWVEKRENGWTVTGIGLRMVS